MSKPHPTATSVSPRELLLLDAAAPAAQLAEGLFLHWQQHWSGHLPLLALVEEQRQAALLEALCRRFRASAPCATDHTALRTAIRSLSDRGACLIAGGGEGEAALLTNLHLGAPLLAALQTPLPLLAVGTMEENPFYGEIGNLDLRPCPFGTGGPLPTA